MTLFEIIHQMEQASLIYLVFVQIIKYCYILRIPSLEGYDWLPLWHSFDYIQEDTYDPKGLKVSLSATKPNETETASKVDLAQLQFSLMSCHFKQR